MKYIYQTKYIDLLTGEVYWSLPYTTKPSSWFWYWRPHSLNRVKRELFEYKLTDEEYTFLNKFIELEPKSDRK